MRQNDEAIDQIGNRRTIRSLEDHASTAFRSPSSVVAITMFERNSTPVRVIVTLEYESPRSPRQTDGTTI